MFYWATVFEVYRNNAYAEEVEARHSTKLLEEVLGNEIPYGVLGSFDLIVREDANFALLFDGTFRNVVAHKQDSVDVWIIPLAPLLNQYQ